jgi:hypothetical protein
MARLTCELPAAPPSSAQQRGQASRVTAAQATCQQIQTIAKNLIRYDVYKEKNYKIIGIVSRDEFGLL